MPAAQLSELALELAPHHPHPSDSFASFLCLLKSCLGNNAYCSPSRGSPAPPVSGSTSLFIPLSEFFPGRHNTWSHHISQVHLSWYLLFSISFFLQTPSPLRAGLWALLGTDVFQMPSSVLETNGNPHICWIKLDWVKLNFTELSWSLRNQGCWFF